MEERGGGLHQIYDFEKFTVNHGVVVQRLVDFVDVFVDVGVDQVGARRFSVQLRSS